ncbi:MAG: PAS domain S-box protein, partial [Bacteroidia bacterium]|nr:PAS domain S-box protein [Bacteroidia bacterium]
MAKKIRILSIDDNLMDLAMIRDSLGKETGRFILTEAKSQAEFEKQISEHKFDVVLTDFNILGYDGLQVLNIVKEKLPVTPVIIVTGTGSEEVAVESIKRGAADYVIKTPSHIRRLPVTIRTVMKQKQLLDKQKLTEEELILKNLVFESSITANSISDNKGIIKYANSAFLKIWDYDSIETVREKPISHFLKNGNEVLEIMTALKETGEWEGEYTGLKKDGSTFDAYGLATVIQNEKNEIIGYQSAVIDITKRKKVEKKNRHLNLVLGKIRNVNQLITKEKDRDKLITGACDNLIETRGYYNAWIVLLDESGKLITTAEGGLGKNFLPMIRLLKSGELTTCGEKALKQTNSVVTEAPAKTCRDCPLAGKYTERGALTIRLEYEGKIYGLISVSVPRQFIKDKEKQHLFEEVASDIAFALHSLEVEEKRKQAEQKLLNNEQNFRDLVNNLMDGVAIADENAYHIYVNPKFSEITGYSRDELLTMTGWDFTRPEDLPELKQRMKDRMAGKPVRPHYERIIVRKDGTEIPVEMSTTVTLWQGKKRPMAIFHDITKRKQSEETLKNNEQFLNNILE